MTQENKDSVALFNKGVTDTISEGGLGTGKPPSTSGQNGIKLYFFFSLSISFILLLLPLYS